ncbi:MAG: hypothetical protein AAFN18_00865 [Cyanobacteria bacterium J06554_6]
MRIITRQVPRDLRTNRPTDYNLTLGQHWEALLAQSLRDRGFRAYQPRQQILHPGDAVRASRKALQGDPEAAEDYRRRKFAIGLLRPLQLDLVARLGKRRWNIEVKALCPAAFQSSLIHIGATGKYDLKVVPVNLLCLINQETSEVFFVPYDPETWGRAKSLRGTGFDYVVPRASMSPLDAWVDYVLADPENT